MVELGFQFTKEAHCEVFYIPSDHGSVVGFAQRHRLVQDALPKVTQTYPGNVWIT